jgi:hypothetical protein
LHSSANFLKDDFQPKFHQQFRQKAGNKDSFHQIMRQAFSDDNKTSSKKGTMYNYEGAEALRQKVLADDLSWLPEVKVLSGSEFSQAQLFHQGQASDSESFRGTFGDGTIFLNESIMSDPDFALSVYSEEAGHAIDKLLNNERDTLGDEGAIFSKLLMGKSLSAKQIQALKAENDHGKLAGVDVEFLSKSGPDKIISDINSSRIEAYKKAVADTREKGKNDGKDASEIEKEISKIDKPKPLTAVEEKEVRYVYSSAKAYGKSDEDADSFTADLMKPDNAAVRKELRETSADWAVGQTLVETVEYIEAKNTLGKISGGLDAAIKGLEKADKIDVPGKDASLMILKASKGAVDTLLAYVDADSSATGASKALTVSGKSITQLLKDIDQGDFVAVSEVMTYVGETWGKFIETDDGLKEWAAATKGIGNTAVSVGKSTGNSELVLFGEVTNAAANFLGAWDIKIEGEPAATGITRTANGVAFVGSAFSAVGNFTGDQWLSNTGNYITEGSKLLGPINTINKLLDPETFDEDAFVTGTTEGVASFVSGSLKLSGMVVGGETGKDLETAGSIVSNLSKLNTAIQGGSSASIASAGIGTVLEILKIAGVDIPPKIQELINAGVSGLAGNTSALGAEAAVKFLAPYVVEVATSVGIELTEKAVTEALNTAVNGLGYAAAVYKLVMVGFDIAKIAENDDLDDTTKVNQSLYALSDTLLNIGLSLSTNPVGWVILALSADLNIHAANVDIIDNGFNKDNLTRLFGGAVGAALFPPRLLNAWFSTEIIDPSAPINPDDQAALDKGVRDDDGILWHTGGANGGEGNRDAYAQIETAFGTNAISLHEFERDLDPTDRYKKMEVYKPLLKQIITTDNNLAAAFNHADEQNGESGATMAGYQSAAVGHPIKLNHDLQGLDLPEMIDQRYETITDQVAASNTKAGQAFNAWVDGIDKKSNNSAGDTIAIIDIISQAPAVLQMSPEIIEQILSTVEPGSVKHVVNQLVSTVGTYTNALSSPLIQGETPMDEQQTLDFVIDKLGLTKDYRFAFAPEKGEGISQRVKDFVAHLNEVGGNGTVQLMGVSSDGDSYQLLVDGELDAYKFMDDVNDTPHFEKVSRAIIDLSGDSGDWPPSNTVNWGDHQFQASRGGDLQWVRPAEGEDETRGLAEAQTLADQLQAKGKDVKLLGISTTDGLFEVMVEGKQHAYKLEGDSFVQVSQRNLQTDIPRVVQKFHAKLNRVRIEDGNKAVQLVGLSDDGTAFQLTVDGEEDTYRYVEKKDLMDSTLVDNSYYEKISRTVVDPSGDWPPSHTVNWSDAQFQASREGNLVQWVKPLSTLTEQEVDGLAIAQSVVNQLQANGKDVKLLGVSNAKDALFEVLVEGKQHSYRFEGGSFIQVSQTKLFAKASSTLGETPPGPTTALPLAEGNAAFMAGNYQGVIDYVDQNPSSGTDQQILDTYKRAAQIGLTLEQPMSQADYKEAAPIFESLSKELKVVAPELASHYSTGASLANQANFIITSVLSNNYTLANSTAKTFLTTMEANPGLAETFGPAMALANNVVAISDNYAAGNFAEAAQLATAYADTIPATHPLKAEFTKIAGNIKDEGAATAIIAEGNVALLAGDYQGVIDYVDQNSSREIDQQILDTYKKAAEIGLTLGQPMLQAEYDKAAPIFDSLSDQLKGVSPELAYHYSTGAALANQANTIITSVLSNDYTQANSSAKTFLATLDATPGREEEFSPAVALARNTVAISDSYSAGNLAEAAQLAVAYAETIPEAHPLRAEFSKIAENIRSEQATAA